MATTGEAISTESGRSADVYDAFISYSHAADNLLAPRLQAGLQRFAKPWWKRRALRVFRDEASLSANPHLWSSITEALDGSEWFVLLLSEEAAQSEWVNREVEYWLELKDPSRIIPVVTDGEFGRADGDIDPSSTAVPPGLLGAFREEPRWVDLRWARSDTQLDLSNARFRNGVADVASAIRNVPKDELESEEVRQHRRTIRTALAGVVVVVVLAVAATVGAIVAVGQSNEAQSQRDGAERLAASEATTRAEADAAAVAEREQRAAAERQTEIAAQEADRATQAASLLLDFILQQDDSGVAPPDREGADATDVLPVPLPIRESPPQNTRLDFLFDFCSRQGGGPGSLPTCYRHALFSNPDDQIGTAFGVAHRPFHIRHGFVNPAEESLRVNGPAIPGYDVRVFVTRRDGPELDGGTFEIGQTFVYHSDYMMRETTGKCGPFHESNHGSTQCDVFVHDFPNGLPPGLYDFWVEWVAPCTAWIETDFCVGLGQSISLFTSQVDIPFFAEDYVPRHLVIQAGRNIPLPIPEEVAWPFEPWDFAEPTR